MGFMSPKIPKVSQAPALPKNEDPMVRDAAERERKRLAGQTGRASTMYNLSYLFGGGKKP